MYSLNLFRSSSVNSESLSELTIENLLLGLHQQLGGRWDPSQIGKPRSKPTEIVF